MPQKRNSTEPPPVMTLGKAIPVLVIAVLFDALRIMFEFFWFFGPALAGVYCASEVSGVLGTAVGESLCGVGATAIGFFGAPAITMFGVVMAIAVGLLGWMTIGFILMLTNARIFKENALWFAGSLLISEVPLVGAIPAFSITMSRMYHRQIKSDKKALAQYEQSQQEERLQEQRQQGALAQANTAQQEAANEEAYAAANDERYNETEPRGEIPENEEMAA